MPTSKVIEAIAVTAELCGRVFSPAAAMVFAGDLDGFEESAVLSALTRCRKEVRGLLTVEDVTSRIDDGRPGCEVAWAMLPRGEDSSVVWTDEMAVAFGSASPLLDAGDKIGARMAFKEAYTKLVSDARDRKAPVNWHPSFGADMLGRQSALMEAVQKKRMGVDRALALIPSEFGEAILIAANVTSHPLLAPPSPEAKKRIGELLLSLKVLA